MNWFGWLKSHKRKGGLRASERLTHPKYPNLKPLFPRSVPPTALYPGFAGPLVFHPSAFPPWIIQPFHRLSSRNSSILSYLLTPSMADTTHDKCSVHGRIQRNLRILSKCIIKFDVKELVSSCKMIWLGTFGRFINRTCVRLDRKSTRLNSSHSELSSKPSSA